MPFLNLRRGRSQVLQQLGWTEGRDLRIDYRWGAVPTAFRDAAALVALAPTVVLASGDPAVESLFRTTSDVPIVFAMVPDPVGSGFVDSLSPAHRLASTGADAALFERYDAGLSSRPFYFGLLQISLALEKSMVHGCSKSSSKNSKMGGHLGPGKRNHCLER
jgi:hypothetical protein